MEYKHISVLFNECIEGLNLKRGQKIIDCTLGGAGHSKAILDNVSPKGQLISFDLDPASIENAKKVLADYKEEKDYILINDNFVNLKENLENLNIDGVDGILMDLGISSYELDDKSRGFSFQGDNPLDMSFSGKEKYNAEYIVNHYSVDDLTKIFREYGEEEKAYYIAKKINEERKVKPIKTTGDLVNVILKAKPRRSKDKIHPATQVFQALRIEVNHELENLERVLPDAVESLKSGGRLAIITFHSLEDRIVKQFFKKESTDCLCDPEIPICICGHKKKIKLVNKKPIIPSDKEIKDNPRSRSSKLRIIEKI